jgi:hypothetical protein
MEQSFHFGQIENIPIQMNELALNGDDYADELVPFPVLTGAGFKKPF